MERDKEPDSPTEPSAPVAPAAPIEADPGWLDAITKGGEPDGVETRDAD